MTLHDLTFRAMRDLNILDAAQTGAADVYTESVSVANDLIDQWALQRFFVYQGGTGAWAVLVAFPDLTTDYTFAPGYARCLQKSLAVALIPSLIRRFKVKTAETQVKQIETEAVEARRAVEGVGVQ